MKVQRIPVSRLNPAPYNPRRDLQPGDPQFEAIKRSLDAFGPVEPLVWNQRTGNLVGGHQRLKILVAGGASEVDVSVVDLPPEEEKVLNLALNRIDGDWDPDRLAVILEELGLSKDVDVSLTGFEPGEISRILDDALKIEEPPAPEIPPAAGDEMPVTRPGELVEVGPHRILCGDSTDPEVLDRLLAGAKANMVFTDPPYGVSYDADRRPTAAGNGNPSRWREIHNDSLPLEEYRAWLDRVVGNVAARLVPGGPVYWWNGRGVLGLTHDLLTAHGIHISKWITWAKPVPAPGFSDYAEQCEHALYGWREGATHPWYGPSNEATLWQIPRDAGNRLVHPTQKPAALARRAIRNSSKSGDLVLDLFLGSGSTLTAAQALGRRCHGTEIDPLYVDSIVRRYIGTFGEDSVSGEVRQRYAGEDRS